MKNIGIASVLIAMIALLNACSVSQTAFVSDDQTKIKKPAENSTLKKTNVLNKLTNIIGKMSFKNESKNNPSENCFTSNGCQTNQYNTIAVAQVSDAPKTPHFKIAIGNVTNKNNSSVTLLIFRSFILPSARLNG